MIEDWDYTLSDLERDELRREAAAERRRGTACRCVGDGYLRGGCPGPQNCPLEQDDCDE